MMNRVSMLLGVAFVLLLSVVDFVEADGLLQKMTNPDAVCLDGSPGAYYVWTGKKLNKFLFFMLGGGLCTYPENCYQRSSTFLGSSTSYPLFQPDSFLSGSVSRDCTINPEFCEYTLIFLMYCDGTLFSGALDDPITVQNTSIYLRGDAIRKSALKATAQLMNDVKATEFLLAGCSAGGYATYLHMDSMVEYILENVPTVTKVGALPQSGFFLLAPNALGEPVIELFMKSLLSMANATHTMSPSCLASHSTDEQWRCAFSPIAFKYSKVPTFVLNSKTDLWQIPCELLATPAHHNESEVCTNVPGYLESDCPSTKVYLSGGKGFAFENCSATQMVPVFDYQSEFLTQLNDTGLLQRSGNGAFIVSCFTHCGACSNDFWPGVNINGLFMHQAVQDWWQDVGSGHSNTSSHVHVDCERKKSDSKAFYECNWSCIIPLMDSKHKERRSTIQQQLIAGAAAAEKLPFTFQDLLHEGQRLTGGFRP